MSRLIVSRSGQRVERQSRLPAPYWQSRGNPLPPSVRMGSRWAGLPVEGSKAWKRSRPSLIARLINR